MLISIRLLKTHLEVHKEVTRSFTEGEQEDLSMLLWVDNGMCLLFDSAHLMRGPDEL